MSRTWDGSPGPKAVVANPVPRPLPQLLDSDLSLPPRGRVNPPERGRADRGGGTECDSGGEARDGHAEDSGVTRLDDEGDHEHYDENRHGDDPGGETFSMLQMLKVHHNLTYHVLGEVDMPLPGPK